MVERIDRSKAAALGRQTVEILSAGRYEGPTGSVDIAASLAAARAGTVSHAPTDVLSPGPTLAQPLPTAFEVTGETTLEASRRLAAEGRVAALNFASAYNPGGGFLGGARAQEESLCRSSGLFACLEGDAMYEHHRAHRDPVYTSWVIYSPAVPVFRTDPGALLDAPYLCSFLTCPAVNVGVVLDRDPSRGPEIEAVMRERIDRVLSVADLHGETTLVLGAWGCGAFRGDPERIAPLFAEALHGRHRGRFARVVFAIVDWTAEQRILGPFRRAFAPAG